jgi:hypothetical protein
VLSSLFDGDFERYFDAAGQGGPLWLFVHVPKTAGSSMQAEMATIHTPAANIRIDYSQPSTKHYQARFDEAVQHFIEQHQTVPYRFAGGHIGARHTDMIREAVPGVKCFTMIRNPIARIISDYRYQRSDMNVGRDEFIAKTPDFPTYVARPFVHNKTAYALVPREIVDAEDGAAAVDYVMNNFVFVGMQEMYPLCLRAITTLMGHPKAAEAKVRVNPETEENRVELIPEQEAELRKLNAVDLALFQAFTSKWRAIRDDLRTYLATRGRKAA